MRKLAIIHFSPVELYPPVMNLLDYFSEINIDFSVKVYTMSPPDDMKIYKAASPNISIIRKGKFTSGMAASGRLYNYFIYYSAVFLSCLREKPSIVLTYETLSFLPAWLY